MHRLLAVAAMTAAAALPAAALAGQFVQDNAHLMSAPAAASLEQRLSNFNAQTGKEVVVDTVTSLGGAPSVAAAAEQAFTAQHVNGVLLYIDAGDRQDYVLPDRALAQSGWWTQQTTQNVLQTMQSDFKAGDYDGGITTGAGDVLDVYRSHLNDLQSNPAAERGNAGYAARRSSSGGIGVIWWIIIALVAFFIIRAIIRAATMGGGRYYGPGAPGPGPGYGGPGYGGPGYGGWGYGGFGGGGFFSGLLGGLGGAWLGNELFGGGGGGFNAPADAGQMNQPMDPGGWQSDPGQMGMGGGGGWSGGGFGGGGDFGGGGGDFGGGGGGSW